MRVIIAPDSFKGCLRSREAAEAMRRGFAAVFPDARFTCLPMSDGGEGLVEALVAATNGTVVAERVQGPLGEEVTATWGVLGDGATAVVETAQASGLQLVEPARRNPLLTSTYGTGQLIRAALDAGYRRVIVGLGGSATADAGAGMAQALGVKLLDEAGRDIGKGGQGLRALAGICLDSRHPAAAETEFIAACDVDNPLLGPEGAAGVYGPQKGATPAMVELLEACLARFAGVVRDRLGVDVTHLAGGGAAGGMGAGLVAFLGARVRRGVEVVMEAAGLADCLVGADLVVTGEGMVDYQTLRGKVPAGVARLARGCGVPVVCVGGSLGPGAETLYAHGVSALVAIQDRPMALDESLGRATELIERACERGARLIAVGMGAASGGGKVKGG